MECKSGGRRDFWIHGKTELIDTLWNVNKDTIIEWDGSTGELIDTLWNVNALNSDAFLSCYQN